MGYNFNQKIQETSKQYGLGQSDAYQFEKGPNKFRVLTMSEKPLATHWVGKKSFNCIGEEEGCQYHGDNAPKNDKGEPARPSIKYLSYVLDRKTSEVKMMYMPYSICKAIGELQMSDDYSFNDLPMPYDLTVNFDPDASPAQMYSVIPSPKVTEVPADFMAKVKEMKSVDEIREQILNKVAGGERKIVTPSGKTVTDEDIPVIDGEEEKVTEKDLPF